MHNHQTAFLDYLEIEKGRSSNTLRNYRAYTQKFLELMNIKDPKDITSPIITAYRSKLNKYLSPKSQNLHLIALRSFLKYLSKQNIQTLAPDQIELAKTKNKLVQFLSGEEIKRLIAASNGTRALAVLEMLFSTGLRVSELCQLDKETVNLTGQSFRVIGKGQRQRIVFLSSSAKQAAANYIETRKDQDPALFVRTKTNQNTGESLRLSPRSIQDIVKTSAESAGIKKKVTPHTIRHSFGTDLLENGADLRSIQELLGHADISTTQIYTHVTNKHLAATFNKCHDKE